MEIGSLFPRICVLYFLFQVKFTRFAIIIIPNFFFRKINVQSTKSRYGTIAVASTVTVFIVIAISFFMAGFLSRHFCQKERKTAATDNKVENTETPYYDDVVLKQQEQELKLKENVAYAPVK